MYFSPERRFRPGMDAQNNIEQVRHYLSDKYDIPPFELEPLLQPLAEVENYVNSNLSVSEERLRFFFTTRGQCPPNSLAWSLYNAIKQDSQYGSLSGSQKAPHRQSNSTAFSRCA